MTWRVSTKRRERRSLDTPRLIREYAVHRFQRQRSVVPGSIDPARPGSWRAAPGCGSPAAGPQYPAELLWKRGSVGQQRDRLQQAVTGEDLFLNPETLVPELFRFGNELTDQPQVDRRGRESLRYCDPAWNYAVYSDLLRSRRRRQAPALRGPTPF